MDKAMNEIDANCKDADGFLYGAYTAQEVFGSEKWTEKKAWIIVVN